MRAAKKEMHMEDQKKSNFIQEIIDRDRNEGRFDGKVITRFPPEPNGYLHIGHAKSICLNFGIAAANGGRCHMRFDDTNPSAEDQEYVDSILEDIRWLGFDWGEHLYFASDYFQQMYELAIQLIHKGKAYVCTLTPEEFKKYRGVPTQPGMESPGRNRSIEENLRLFEEMKEGKHEDGSYVLRAKIDMASPNLHMRDPAIYRIKKAHHHRAGDRWCIYPMYDFAHGLEDSIEGVTHSICTLEFEVHRPLYDWLLEAIEVYHPRQIEFARLNLTYTVMSKRKLLQLVSEGYVDGWDDPRMPTLAGMRRRGFPAAAIRTFCDTIGVTKFNSLTDVALLEHCIRDELNRIALRALAVLNPVKLIIDNYPDDGEEYFNAVNNPEDERAGTRKIPFSKELYIERHDFMEDPPKKFHRLYPGNEVRLKYACLVTCTGIVKDPESGLIREIHCTYDPASRGGSAPDGRKVRGTIHWVSARHAIEIEARMYDRLFTEENPADEKDGRTFIDKLNTEALKVVTIMGEPSLCEAAVGQPYQLERTGYFCADTKKHIGKTPVLNQTLPLRDSWSKKNT